MNLKKTVFPIFVLAFGFLFSNSPSVIGANANSAAVNIYATTAKGGSFFRNETVVAQLRVETGAKEINALDVLLEYPADLLDLEGISDGDSVINIWIEKPQKISGQNCRTGIINCQKIKFSGVIPGGFTGNGLLLALNFKALKDGLASLNFDSNVSKIFLNKSNAQQVDAFYQPLTVDIEGGNVSSKNLVLDYFPPERFSISLDKSSKVYNNEWFIGFSTQDKGSGISHYEIKEKFLGLFDEEWNQGNSPYVLRDQWLLSSIAVKAIDNTGLEREETMIPKRLIDFYFVTILVAITLLGFGVVAGIKRK